MPMGKHRTVYGHWQLPESINKVFTTEFFFLMNGEKTVLKIGTSTRMNGVCYLTIAIIKLKRLNELVAISVQINNNVFFRSIQVEGNYSLLFNSLHFFGVEFKDGPL